MTQLTVGDTRPVVQYTADGTQTDFAYPFPIVSASDLVVVADDGTAPGGHSITGVGDSQGGTVVFDTAPASGTRLTLYRDMPVARTADFVEAGDFRASALNAELDRLALMLQQVEETAGRAVRRAPSDLDEDLTLPPKAQRADALLGFDAAGQPTVLSEPKTAADEAAVSASDAATSASEAATSASDAAADATTAANAASTATSAATTASNAASDASSDASAAAASASTAEAWAETPEDTEVATGAYSAKHWAAKAQAAAPTGERRRIDLATQRMRWALAHPGVAAQPAWGVDFALGLGLDELTVSRASPATYYDARGQLMTAAADELRLDHDPATGEALGALIENERTNVLHDSFNPAAQTRTLNADTYTVSMAGSGQVDLSGAASGTVTAGNPLTFSLGSSGDVTFTPSGTVSVFQCEAGATATSFIETPSGGSATRAADHVEALDLSWFAPAHATLVLEMAYPQVPTDNGSRILSLDDGGDSNRHNLYWAEWAQKLSWFTKSGGSSQGNISGLTGGWGGDGTWHRIGLRLGGGQRTLYVDGSQHANDSITDTSGLTHLRLGGYHVDQQQLRGHIRRLTVWNVHLPDADLGTVTG